VSEARGILCLIDEARVAFACRRKGPVVQGLETAVVDGAVAGSRPAAMRFAVTVPALLFVTGSVAMSAEAGAIPTKDCAAAFAAKWAVDRETALGRLPKRPCWMHTGNGLYVCYRDGCVRPHVYFNSQ
jgi:hypothetical protein